ncbi:MAG: hypothetical protein GDA54_02035 [Alphaproteobacteria bacterium GM7ARS4]|nr:hypothetical protein [Alphaproteobacteria bacterium GM7ARS4]
MGSEDKSLIPYRLWLDEGMRLIAKRTIQHIIAHGLQGKHHLYLTFRTDRDDVTMAESLRKRYPERMTILLQHQFQNLQTNDVAFSVTLFFHRLAYRLSIPYDALEEMRDPIAPIELHLTPACSSTQGTTDAKTRTETNITDRTKPIIPFPKRTPIRLSPPSQQTTHKKTTQTSKTKDTKGKDNRQKTARLIPLIARKKTPPPPRTPSQ